MKKNNFLHGVIVGVLSFLIFNLFFMHSDIFAFKSFLSPNFKVGQIFNLLDKYYINEYDKQDAENFMYQGLLNSVGDPYTCYIDKKTLSEFTQQIEGSYVGIGAVVSVDEQNNCLIIVSPYENAPAAKAGILPGDKLLEVDNIKAYKENYEEIINKLRGQTGTSVKTKIFRPSENKTLEINIMREKIDIPTVIHKIFDKNIGYLRITSFDRNTHEQFLEAYKLISQNNNLKGLIIDLRNNPGGLLDTVIKIADEIIPKGCIVYTEDKSGEKKYFYADEKYIKLPLVILTNKNSASASEVLAGAVKDLKRGMLVGTKTFGKGLVQNLFNLSDGSGVKITVAKYYTPAGICINGTGIEPDYKIELDSKNQDKLISSLTLSQDAQLRKAISLLNKS